MTSARIPFRFWLVGLAVSFFLAGVILRVSAAIDFSITSPLPNSVVTGQSVTLTFSLPQSFKIVDYQTHPHATFGQGHIRLWIDSSSNPKDAIPVTSDTYTLSNLKYGSHLVTAELVTNDDASLIPKTVTTLSFTTTPPPSVAPQALQYILTVSILSVILISAAMLLVSQHRKLPLPKKSSRRSR